MHRRERMMPHARLRKQHLPHKEMPHVDRPAVFRKCRARDGETRPKLIEKRIRHRPDVAGVRRVEGRAVFEIDLPRPMLFQPAAGSKRLRDGIACRNGAGFEGNDNGIRVGRQARGLADDLHRAHAVAAQRIRQIRGAREIVGNATQQHGPIPPRRG